VVTTKRVGVDYAKEWKDEMLRFLDAKSPGAAKQLRKARVFNPGKSAYPGT
jgi:hypothetical protein